MNRIFTPTSTRYCRSAPCTTEFKSSGLLQRDETWSGNFATCPRALENACRLSRTRMQKTKTTTQTHYLTCIKRIWKRCLNVTFFSLQWTKVLRLKASIRWMSQGTPAPYTRLEWTVTWGSGTCRAFPLDKGPEVRGLDHKAISTHPCA